MDRELFVQSFFGTDIKKSVNYIKASLFLSVVIIICLNVYKIFGQLGSDELITVGLLFLLLAIPSAISYKNNGLLVTLSVPSLIVFSFVTSGFGVGWTHDPTVVEEYLVTPIRFAMMIGLPAGFVGYLIGRLAEASYLSSS